MIYPRVKGVGSSIDDYDNIGPGGYWENFGIGTGYSKKYFSAPLYLGCWLAVETEASELLDFNLMSPSESEILDFNSFQIPIKFINLEAFLGDGA